MIINSIKLPLINFTSLSKPTPVSNQPKTDTFCASKIKEFEFNSNISSKAKKQIMQWVRYIIDNQEKIKPLGYGATGVVYQARDIDGFGYNGAVIKISYTEDKNPITGEKQKVGYDYEDEIKILKQVESLGDNSQQYLGKIKLDDERTILITSFVDGIEPDCSIAPLNKQALISIMGSLQKLDEIGILHRDLKKENLVIDEENNVKLIDFGEAINFDIKNSRQQDENNFAPFEAPTNFQSFEDTFISPYIDDLQKIDPKDAKEFFKKYLTLKSKLVFMPRAQNLASYMTKNRQRLMASEIVHLRKMMHYQETMATVLDEQNLSDEIIAIELMKNQVLYMSELAYKNEVLIGNPLANVALKANALICTKKLEEMIQKQINRPNKPEVRKYLNYQLEGTKYRQQKIAGWLNGLIGWFTSCLTDDINTKDESRKKLIDECLTSDLENFEIPNIAQRRN